MSTAGAVEGTAIIRKKAGVQAVVMALLPANVLTRGRRNNQVAF